ncbi:MAG: hypothetical protein ACRELD_09580, partial [Longimicrobiales bacterium]
SESAGAGPGRPRAPGGARQSDTPGLAGQRKLLLLLLRDPRLIARALERLEADDFTDGVNREIFVALLAQVEGVAAVEDGGGTTQTEAEDDAAGGGALVARLDLGEAAMGRVRGLLLDPEELTDTDRMFEDLVNDVRSERLHRRLDEIQALLPVAQANDEIAVVALLQEAQQIAQALQRMGKPVERSMVKGAAAALRRGVAGPRTRNP